MRLDERVCVVTGAAGGMGRAVVETFLAAGAAVVATDLSAERLAELEAEVGGERLVTRPGDVSGEADVAAVIDLAVSRFGRLDAAVNAAAIEFERVPLHELTLDDYERMMAVNTRSVFLSMKAELAAILASPVVAGRERMRGSIVNIASTNSFIPQNHQPAYTASKHGLIGFTRAAAMELAPHGITVNAVCPNHVTTGLGAWQNAFMAAARGETVEQYLAGMRGRIPLGRVGTPEDTAAAVAFLCSDDAAYVTAEAMNVSGGEEYH